MKTNNKFIVLLVVLAIGVAGVIGWYAWQGRTSDNLLSSSKNAGNNNDRIQFVGNDSIDGTVKQEIMDKIAGPFVYYHDNIIKTDLQNVVISKITDPAGPDDYRYRFAYYHASSKQESGFLFGANNKIGYWRPALCDPGGCTPYPEDFKQKYPKTYNAYVECQAANEANDKDKANSVCVM